MERCQRNVSIDNLDKKAKALKLSAADLLREVHGGSTAYYMAGEFGYM